ncbi:glycosyltransferase family 2 protein [Flavobacteriales bacterium]|nr:glycosyltransferase family 2 protein [Flavobacteriales bacterium]
MNAAAILIPCYNAADFLEATLQSAVENMEVGDELVLVDDHSKDESFSLAKKFLSHSGVNFTASKNPSKGACAARNHALSISKNPLIQWLDADDILGKDKLKEQKLKLAGNPNSILVSPFVPFIGNPETGFLDEHRDWNYPEVLTGADWLASGQMTIPACWLGPRHLFEHAGPWDTQLKVNQDGEYFARVLAQAKSVIFEPNVTVWYRRGNNASVSQFSAEKAASLFASVDSIHKTTLALEDSPRMRQMLSNRYQHAIYTAYPHCQAGIEKARSALKGLPKPTISNPNAMSPMSQCISSIFGWKMLTRFRLLRNKLSP